MPVRRGRSMMLGTQAVLVTLCAATVVLVQGREGLGTTVAANGVTGGLPGGEIRPGDGASEFFGNGAFLSLYAPTSSQHALWFAMRTLPALGLALVWWLLSQIVASVRRSGGFDTSVARRLDVIGLLVLVGMPVLELGRWLVARWLVETSSAAGVADVPPLHLDVWPFAVGLAVLVLASAWRTAAAMREDLDGLV